MVSLTLGILAGNLCPPESLGSVSLYPHMQNTLCLPMRIRLKCVQSSRLLERKKEIVWHVFFFLFSFFFLYVWPARCARVPMHNYLYGITPS